MPLAVGWRRTRPGPATSRRTREREGSGYVAGDMDGLALFLLAFDILLVLILLDAEAEEESRRRLERVEARRQALRRQDRDREQ